MAGNVYLTAVKLPDETWTKHKAVWDACAAAGVSVPEETVDYFGGEDPDESGVLVSLGSIGYPDAAASPWCDDDNHGVQIDLSRLPVGTTLLRLWWG